jgi:Rad3-related DNA helicase
LVFCPYNYVLDPKIRSAMDINVENAIIVLDEAHNVEDTLRQEGSGKYGEIEILDMNVLLSSYASKWEPSNQRLDSSRKEESMHDKMPEVAHDILVFLDKIYGALKESRDGFENNQGKQVIMAIHRLSITLLNSNEIDTLISRKEWGNVCLGGVHQIQMFG